MSEGSNKSLIDISELSRTITEINNKLKYQEAVNDENARNQQKTEKILESFKKELFDFQSLSKSFSKGLGTLSNIEEQLVS